MVHHGRTYRYWGIYALHVGFFYEYFNCFFTQRLDFVLFQGFAVFQLLNPPVELGHGCVSLCGKEYKCQNIGVL